MNKSGSEIQWIRKFCRFNLGKSVADFHGGKIFPIFFFIEPVDARKTFLLSLFSQPPGQRHRRHNMCLFAPHSTIFVCRASREILWEIIFNFRGFSSRHLYSALTSLTIFPRLDETNADFSLQGVKNTFADDLWDGDDKSSDVDMENSKSLYKSLHRWTQPRMLDIL